MSDDPNRVIGYHLYVSLDPNLPLREWRRLTDTPKFGDTVKVSKDIALRGTVFYMCMTAVNEWGIESEPSEPQKLTGTGSPQDTVIGINIYQSTDPNLPLDQWQRINKEPVTGGEFRQDVSELQRGVTYYSYVRSVDTWGNESPPTEVQSQYIPTEDADES